MQESELAQIRLIIHDSTKLALREIDQRIDGIMAANSAKGLLRSGLTIQQTVDAVASTTIKTALVLCESVKRVSATTEAFEILHESLFANMDELESRCFKVVKTTTGRPGIPGNPGMLKVCKNLFEQFREDLSAKLEIERFAFAGSTSHANLTIPNAVEEVAVVKRKGGRPPAEFWDDLWAHVAFALYNGDLVPTKQSDIEGAMADWLSHKHFSASPSTIRGRARRLWDLIETADD